MGVARRRDDAGASVDLREFRQRRARGDDDGDAGGSQRRSRTGGRRSHRGRGNRDRRLRWRDSRAARRRRVASRDGPQRTIARRIAIHLAGRRRADGGGVLLDRITPLILTRDEEANIGRTLAQLTWAREVVVLDSMSSDATVEIARRFPNVRVVRRAFDSHAAQWAFGVAQVGTEWVLTLDADYFVPGSFVRELASLAPPPDLGGYEAGFNYAVGGRPIRCALYPPRAVLLHRGAFDIWQDGH